MRHLPRLNTIPISLDVESNISYLMDRNGDWTLAPAYDVCYAYNPAGDWTSSHQMSVNGKKSGIGQEDLLAASKIAGLPEKVARQIVGEVRDAVQAWPQFAAEAAVKDSFTGEIAKLLCG